jgi:poly(3-hydroxybutyrate) depolymerase
MDRWTKTSLFALGLSAVFLSGSEAQAAWSSETLGGTTVDVYTPATTSPTGDGRALMIVLHGCSQAATALRDSGNLESTAESLGVVMAVPTVPNGGVLAGCWDYYGAIHTRNSGHNGALISIAEGLTANGAMMIDPDQVYLAGFSSGGGQAMITGCLAPDIFSGIAVVAGPGVGTQATQIAQVGTTGAQAANTCQSLAGGSAGQLATQLGVTFTDSADVVVANGYNAVNAEMFATVMSDGIGSMMSADIDMATLTGTNPTGTVTVYSDGIGPRVAQIESTSGTNHAWPAGDGAGAGGLGFVSGTGLDFGYYAAEFFATNNVRTGGWDGETGSGSDTDSGGDTTDGSSGGDDSDSDSNSGGDPSGGETDGGETDGPVDATVSTGDDSAGSASGGGESDSDTDGLGNPGLEERVEPSGIQCNAGGSRGGGLLGLGLLMLGLRQRRRRED